MKEKDFGIESSTDKREARLRGLKKFAAAGSIAVAAFGLGACNDNASAESEPQSSVSTEASQSDSTISESGTESESGESGTQEQEYTVEDLEIEAGLSDEELGDTLMERLEQWENAQTPKDTNAKMYQMTNLGLDASINYLVNENEQVFTSALMADGWENEPFAISLVNYMTERNQQQIGGANASLGKKEAIPVTTYTVDSVSTPDSSFTPWVKEGTEYDRVLFVEYTWANEKVNASESSLRAIFALRTVDEKERIVSVVLKNSSDKILNSDSAELNTYSESN